MTILEGAFLGFVGGLATAIGGAYKDAPMEGFDWKTFVRSPFAGIIAGAAFRAYAPAAQIPETLLGAMGIERFFNEGVFKVLTGKVPGKFRHGEWKIRPPQLSKFPRLRRSWKGWK